MFSNWLKNKQRIILEPCFFFYHFGTRRFIPPIFNGQWPRESGAGSGALKWTLLHCYSESSQGHVSSSGEKFYVFSFQISLRKLKIRTIKIPQTSLQPMTAYWLDWWFLLLLTNRTPTSNFVISSTSSFHPVSQFLIHTLIILSVYF